MKRCAALLSVSGLLCATPLASPTSAEIDRASLRALVQESVADSPPSAHATSYPLLVGDEERGFRLQFDGFLQFQYIASFRGDEDGADPFEGGFRLRRLRLTALGRLYEDQIRFKITSSFDRDTGKAELSDAYTDLRMVESVTFRFGQFKLPFLREELTSAKRLLGVDRSITTNVFTLERGEGIQASLGDKKTTFDIAFSDGGDSINTRLGEDPADWAFTARFEHALAGEVGVFSAAGGPPGGDLHVALGLAGHIEQAADRPGSSDDLIASWTADLSAKGDGWSAQIAGVGRSRENALPSGGDAVDWGALIQGGLFVADATELFARIDTVIPDADRDGDDPFTTLTVGFNWYLHGHAAKFSFDVQWSLDDAAGNDLIEDLDNVGLLGAGTDAGEILLRAQWQLLF